MDTGEDLNLQQSSLKEVDIAFLDMSITGVVPAQEALSIDEDSVTPKPEVDTPETAVEDMIPKDIKHLTIRNLDTNEEYVIGENDPFFEFDTFELRGGDSEECVHPPLVVINAVQVLL